MMQKLEQVWRVDAGDAETDEALVGLNSDMAFKAQENARFAKTKLFLMGQCTPDKLMATAATLLPMTRLMNTCFKSSRRFEAAAPAMVTFCGPEAPAWSVMGDFCTYLDNDQHSHWWPFLQQRAWTMELYVLAAIPMWMELGELFNRFIVPFQGWPLLLAALVSPTSTYRQKHETAQELLRACPHSDAFTKRYKEGLVFRRDDGREGPVTAADVLSEKNVTFTKDLFDMMPISNIISESSFAASHVRRSTAHGNQPCSATLASNHVLATAKTDLDLDLQQRKRQAPVRRVEPGVLRTPWEAYLRTHRKDHDLRTLSNLWAQLSPEEKAAYKPCRQGGGGGDVVAPQALPHLAAPQPWPGCGDDFYPIKAEFLEEVARQVPVFSRAWAARIGNTALTPAPTEIDAKVKHTCEELYGRGRCYLTMKHWRWICVI